MIPREIGIVFGKIDDVIKAQFDRDLVIYKNNFLIGFVHWSSRHELANRFASHQVGVISGPFWDTLDHAPGLGLTETGEMILDLVGYDWVINSNTRKLVQPIANCIRCDGTVAYNSNEIVCKCGIKFTGSLDDWNKR